MEKINMEGKRFGRLTVIEEEKQKYIAFIMILKGGVMIKRGSPTRIMVGVE